MVHTNIAVGLAAAAIAASGIIAGAQSSPPSQSGSTSSATGPKQGTSTNQKQVTLSGCVRQTSDDPRVFALISSEESRKKDSGSARTTADANTSAAAKNTTAAVGTAGSMDNAPAYRLQDNSGQKLKEHVGRKVEITGTVTPAKDEQGADIVMSRAENIGVDTVTVTTIDLKPAPMLDVSSVRRLAGECPAAKTPKREGGAERRP